MICFTIHNRQHELIDDAEIFLNGEKVPCGPGSRYCIEDTPPPFHLTIHRTGYLDVEYDNIDQLSGQLYLIRENEDYYYESFVKVPCLRTRHLLVVSLRRANQAGQVIPPSDARKTLDSLLGRMHMRVVEDYGERLKDEPRPKGMDTRDAWAYIYLVGRNDGKEFPETSRELAELRGNAEVAFAGPALVADEHLSNPVSYHPMVHVQFSAATEPREAERILASIGDGRVIANVIAGTVTYTLTLPPEMGMGINRLVEKLRERGEVTSAQPEIWRPK